MAGGMKRTTAALNDGAKKGKAPGKRKRAGPKRTSKVPPSRQKGNVNINQQGNRANVRQNTTRQGNRRSA
jgi:hypothetical protein